MASAGKKKAPGLLDQIGNLFGGDKKKKSKGSFRGALSSSPARPAAAASKKKGEENAVAAFVRTLVSPAPPKSRKSQSAKAKKAPTDGTGTLSKIFKM